MIIHKQPITHIQAIPYKGIGSLAAALSITTGMRFSEIARPVVVAAVGQHYW